MAIPLIALQIALQEMHSRIQDLVSALYRPRIRCAVRDGGWGERVEIDPGYEISRNKELLVPVNTIKLIT